MEFKTITQFCISSLMQINLLVIRTSNPKALSLFYERLGMVFQYHQHGNGPMHYSAEFGGLVFEIYPLLKSQETADHSLRLGFDVDSLDELILKLKEVKVEIIQQPIQTDWGYVAIIKDPDNRKIELKQILPKQVTS